MQKSKKNKLTKSWVNRHLTDHYVHLAQKNGYRSRAAYKLLEIDEKFNLFTNVNCVIDLGCAPGSWAQVICNKVHKLSKIIGVDLLPVLPINGLEFIRGDFTEEETLNKLIELIDQASVDLILSDMSPNLSGIKSVDQARSALLAELVLDFADKYLKRGGNCLIKVFYGGEFDNLRKAFSNLFNKVVVYKPDASRSESNEVYLLGKDKK